MCYQRSTRLFTDANDEHMNALLRENSNPIFGEANVYQGPHMTASTDMGDVSHLDASYSSMGWLYQCVFPYTVQNMKSLYLM